MYEGQTQHPLFQIVNLLGYPARDRKRPWHNSHLMENVINSIQLNISPRYHTNSSSPYIRSDWLLVYSTSSIQSKAYFQLHFLIDRTQLQKSEEGCSLDMADAFMILTGSKAAFSSPAGWRRDPARQLHKAGDCQNDNKTTGMTLYRLISGQMLNGLRVLLAWRVNSILSGQYQSAKQVNLKTVDSWASNLSCLSNITSLTLMRVSQANRLKSERRCMKLGEQRLQYLPTVPIPVSLVGPLGVEANSSDITLPPCRVWERFIMKIMWSDFPPVSQPQSHLMGPLGHVKLGIW